MNEDNANLLPEDSIPCDLNEINDSEELETTIDKVITDVGPEIIEEMHNSNEELVQTYIETDDIELCQIDQIKKGVKIDWPIADTKPINEFEYDGLCGMAFPTLFPFGLGDPTKKSRNIAVSETDGFKHLLKYATKNSVNNNFYYPFAKHQRFKFWAYDRIRRHRALDQSNIYLKQNLGKNKT